MMLKHACCLGCDIIGRGDLQLWGVPGIAAISAQSGLPSMRQHKCRGSAALARGQARIQQARMLRLADEVPGAGRHVVARQVAQPRLQLLRAALQAPQTP
jgi:hypothetical protein